MIEKLCEVSYDSSKSSDDEEPPTKVLRIDFSERLRGGFQRHQHALFPATDRKIFPPRHCRICQKSGIIKDIRVFCKKCKAQMTYPSIYHSCQTFLEVKNLNKIYSMFYVCNFFFKKSKKPI